MSTLRATRLPQIRGTRLRTRVLALSALIAIGATALVLALTGANHTRTPSAANSGAQPRSHTPATVKSAAPAGATSHAFPAAQIPDAIANPLGYFRDPATHAVIPVRPTGLTSTAARSSAPTRASAERSLTPAERRYVLGLLR